jgi:hypothetical protein
MTNLAKLTEAAKICLTQKQYFGLVDKIMQHIDDSVAKLGLELKLSGKTMPKRGMFDRLKNWWYNMWHGHSNEKNPYYQQNKLGYWGRPSMRNEMTLHEYKLLKDQSESLETVLNERVALDDLLDDWLRNLKRDVFDYMSQFYYRNASTDTGQASRGGSPPDDGSPPSSPVSSTAAPEEKQPHTTTFEPEPEEETASDTETDTVDDTGDDTGDEVPPAETGQEDSSGNSGEEKTFSTKFSPFDITGDAGDEDNRALSFLKIRKQGGGDQSGEQKSATDDFLKSSGATAPPVAEDDPFLKSFERMKTGRPKRRIGTDVIRAPLSPRPTGSGKKQGQAGDKGAETPAVSKPAAPLTSDSLLAKIKGSSWTRQEGSAASAHKKVLNEKFRISKKDMENTTLYERTLVCLDKMRELKSETFAEDLLRS